MPMDAELAVREPIAVPAYLRRIYWWAYVHPHAVRVFERQWLVNLILWGNFGRLRDEAIDALGPALPGATLQVACVYGNLTERLARRLPDDGRLDVVDVLRIQLDNLARKLPYDHGVNMVQGDAAALEFPTASYDRALLFFLLHEMPERVRRATLAETLRVVRPGGRVVIVDYHKPHPLNPLFWPMVAILRTLEPFAMDLWDAPIETWLPPLPAGARLTRETSFGGLYQRVTIDL